MSHESEYQDYPTESQINQKSKKDNDCIVLNIHNKKLPFEASLASAAPPFNMTETKLKIDEKLDDKKPDKSLHGNNRNIANDFIYYDNTRENQKKNNNPYTEKRGKNIKEEESIHNKKNKYSKSFNPTKINEIIEEKSDKDENTKEQIIPKQNDAIKIENIIEKDEPKPKEKNCCSFCLKRKMKYILMFICCILTSIVSPCTCCCFLAAIIEKMKEDREKENNNN
jgi:hypothetical protein